MKIRIANLSDSKAIQKLNSIELHYDYPLEDTTKKLELILSLDWQIIYVAEIDGQVAGYVQAHKYIGTFGDLFVNIMGLAVSKDFQGNGVGKALMFAAENWAQEIGAEGVRLNSGSERTEAHKFYEKIGYDKAKTQAKFQKIL
jgi:ribosomal protein S18 acetylase RimI-like enzyme